MALPHPNRSDRSDAEARRGRTFRGSDRIGGERLLGEATSILASSLDYPERVSRVADLIVGEIADGCVIHVARGGKLEPVALSHIDPEKAEVARRIQNGYPPDPDADLGVYEVFRTGEPKLAPEISPERLREVARGEEHLRMLRSLDLRSAVIAPLAARGCTLGVLTLVGSGPDRSFGDDELRLVYTLADILALAVDDAWLDGELKHAEERADFLSEAGCVLTASLDFESTLRALARLAVPTFADWCVVDVLEEGATTAVRRIASEHIDPEKREIVDSLHRRYPAAPGSKQPASIALFEGRTVFHRELTDEELERTTRDREHFRMLREVGVHSGIAVPLIARGETLGAMTLVIADPERSYGPGDVTTAEDFARRGAAAIDTARLYERTLVASKARADFMAVMSHELRTPLNAAVGYADLLAAGLEGQLNAGQKRQVVRLGATLRQLIGLVERILEFSRLEIGREEVRSEAFDLVEAVREVVDLVRPRAAAVGVDVVTDLAPGPRRIETDRDKLRTILLTLLSNAAKFTDEGEIGVRTAREDDTLAIDVWDTGVGIPTDKLETVFVPFRQAERPTTRRAGGIGLGLTVARRLARLLGGDIAVESEPGRGSTFRVRFPVRWLPENGDGEDGGNAG